MGVATIFYAALGYLALVVATLCAMLFIGEGSNAALMDAGSTGSPLYAALIDIGLLALLGLVRGLARRRESPRPLERATHAWAFSIVVLVLLLAWHPLPKVLWSASGPATLVASALFYAGWALVFIGIFLTYHTNMFELSELPQSADEGRSRPPIRRTTFLAAWMRHPSYVGLQIGIWSTSVMSVGHFLLAAAISGYFLCDALWVARNLRQPDRAHAVAQSFVPIQQRPEGAITARTAHHA